MNEEEARRTRFEGTVGVYFSCISQIDSRDWDNIREFKGTYHPLLGYYKNDDPDVLRQQLQWIRRAGIDAVVYDVYGFGKWDPTDLPKDKVLPLLVEELANQESESRKLKLIIWLEKYLANPTLEQYRYALDYIQKQFAERDFYYKYAGRPMVVTYLNDQNDVIDQVEWENEFFSMRRIRPYYSDVWAYVDHWPQRLNREWMPASPGFNAYMENAYIAKYVREQENPDYERLRREANDGDAGREDGAFFKKQLLRVREGEPKIAFISGWNDWQYANQIEPAVEYEFKYIDLAAQLLGREEETAPYRR